MINYNLVKGIEGWCSTEKMTKMTSLILATKPQRVVEIGVFYGKSLICQALAMKKNKIGKIYGIDSWNPIDCLMHMTNENDIKWWSSLNYDMIYDQCITNIRESETEHFVHILKDNSMNVANNINFPIDILHIDGNHEALSACQNVSLYVPKIKSGGFLWFNDADWEQSKKAIELIEQNFKLQLIDKAKSDDINNHCNLYIKL
jgi:cephalosporin hydroxylase